MISCDDIVPVMAGRTLVSLGDDRIMQLEQLAAARGRSRAALIREAIDRLIEEGGPEQDRQRRRAGCWPDSAPGRTGPIAVTPSNGSAANAPAGPGHGIMITMRSLKRADAVILASAQVNGRVLVTRNTQDFPASMPGLHVPYMFEQR